MHGDTAAGSRAFVLGLDGVPWRLLREWADAGALPNVATLLEEGAAGPLASTTPATTPLAWTSIATGTRPDKHGVYGFRELRADYTHRVYTAADVARPTLWEELSPAVVGNVPMTYPAAEIDGAMVCGMMAPAVGEGFAHPPALLAELESTIPDYEIGLDWSAYDGAVEAFLADLDALLAGRRALMRLLMDRDDWRLFFFVYTAPDRLQHLVWDEDVLVDHYRDLDDVLGEVMAYVAERDATLYVVSDHGFGPVSTHVAVNRVLADEGLVVRRRPSGVRGALGRLGVTKDAVTGALDRLGVDRAALLARLPGALTDEVATRVPGDHVLYDVDQAETVAFVHELGNVYVNDARRFARGPVDPAEVPAVKRELARVLAGVADPEPGERVLDVHDGDELFPTDPDAPDLVVETADGYEVSTALADATFLDAETKAASHRSEGVFLAWGPDVAAGATPADATVYDVAPTVLHGAGAPVPEGADGRVLAEVFAPGSAPAVAEPRTRAVERAGRRRAVDEDLDDVEDRLRGLGYLD